jgi:hypothetical protein
MEQFYNKEKCEQRNRIAAQREEVEGVPVRFLSDGNFATAPIESAGVLPEDEGGAMAAINALLPEGAPQLKADEVYIHYLEAANDSFIGDRYAHIAESTLRNIATDATAGVSFMNSHRTGSVSTPSELPFGKTFAGQYRVETDANGKPKKCAMVGFYMLRGIKPNGENGPSTDDLHKMIVGGQVADVSVGLSQGEKRCDVCSGNLSDCEHVPGTRRAMLDSQIQSQTDRGIPGGRASYTIEGARMGEVSAVFNGAVPGAGVKKVMLNRRKLGTREWREARQAFGALLNRGAAMDESLFDQVTEAVQEGVERAFAAKPAALASEETEMAAGTQTAPVTDTALAELQVQLAAQQAELAALKEENAKKEQLAAQATERVQRLEADAQAKRFRDEVLGVNGGTRWIGDADAHVKFMCGLAQAFGEDSEQVKHYVTRERAHAALFAESKVAEPLGSERAGGEQTAASQLEALAKQRQSEKTSLSYAQAYNEVLGENPALYAQFRAEGGK